MDEAPLAVGEGVSRRTVAVLDHAVPAHLFGAREHARVRVVAIRRHVVVAVARRLAGEDRRVPAVAVAVLVEVPVVGFGELVVVVDEQVAVVVELVAHLVGTRVDVLVVIVAVAPDRRAAERELALLFHGRVVAVVVRILVPVGEQEQALVDLVVTVVVDLVALLRGARVDGRIVVVAIVPRLDAVLVRVDDRGAVVGLRRARVVSPSSLVFASARQQDQDDDRHRAPSTSAPPTSNRGPRTLIRGELDLSGGRRETCPDDS